MKGVIKILSFWGVLFFFWWSALGSLSSQAAALRGPVLRNHDGGSNGGGGGGLSPRVPQRCLNVLALIEREFRDFYARGVPLEHHLTDFRVMNPWNEPLTEMFMVGRFLLMDENLTQDLLEPCSDVLGCIGLPRVTYSVRGNHLFFCDRSSCDLYPILECSNQSIRIDLNGHGSTQELFRSERGIYFLRFVTRSGFYPQAQPLPEETLRRFPPRWQNWFRGSYEAISRCHRDFNEEHLVRATHRLSFGSHAPLEEGVSLRSYRLQYPLQDWNHYIDRRCQDFFGRR